MAAKELIYELFDICGTDPDDLNLLVHIEEAGGDWESYRTAVVKLSRGALLLDVLWDDWAQAFWQSPTGVIYVGGARGTIYSKVSSQWSSVSLGRKLRFQNIWGLSDDTVYTCGSRSIVWRKSKDGWAAFNEGLTGDFATIRGTAPGDLYVVGTEGVVFHHDGIRWTQIQSPTNNNLISILPMSRTEAYVCGYNGTFFRLANGAWEDFSLQTNPVNLYRLAMYGKRLFVSAAGKGLFEFDGHSLVRAAPNLLIGKMHVIGGRLFGVGGDLIHVYDGTSWTSTKLDFSQVI